MNRHPLSSFLADDWAKEVSAKGLPGEEMRDSARSLVKKYNK